jgi:hypothetical protein
VKIHIIQGLGNELADDGWLKVSKIVHVPTIQGVEGVGTATVDFRG